METRFCLASVEALRDPELFARGLSTVSEQRREKLARLRAEAPRLLSLGAALLLDRMLADADLPPAGPFAFGEQGKPYLPDLPDVHFSLSHSGTRVLCALSDAELGCDVEGPRRFDPALARRFFHPDETAWLFSLPPREQDAAFLRLWTLKESYLKAVGLGLSLPLDAFRILPEGGDFALTLQEDAHPWALRSFDAEDCLCAICALDPPEKLERLSLFPDSPA